MTTKSQDPIAYDNCGTEARDKEYADWISEGFRFRTNCFTHEVDARKAHYESQGIEVRVGIS